MCAVQGEQLDSFLVAIKVGKIQLVQLIIAIYFLRKPTLSLCFANDLCCLHTVRGMSRKGACCISFPSAVLGCGSPAGLLAAAPPPSLVAHVLSCSPPYATSSSPKILLRILERLRHNRKKPCQTTKTEYILTKPEIIPGWGQRCFRSSKVVAALHDVHIHKCFDYCTKTHDEHGSI